MRKGKFITIEGGDGAGKSTQIKNIVDFLEGRGIEVVQTREPGGTKIGERLRALILGDFQEEDNLSLETIILLMFASRAQHLQEVIIPKLEKGKWVVCDRFTDSTKAYQGAGQFFDMDKIDALDEIVTGTFKPDITFYLDVDVETGNQRSSKTGENKDRFEVQSDEFKKRVRNHYLSLVDSEPERVVHINATKSIEEVSSQIRKRLSSFLQKNIGGI